MDRPLNLHNPRIFPTFLQLPKETEPSLVPYHQDGNNDRNWCLLGQVETIGTNARGKTCLVVRDNAGHNFPVLIDLHPDAIFGSNRFNLDQRPPGTMTIALFYAKMHSAVNGRKGVVVQDDIQMELIPVALDEVMMANDVVQAQAPLNRPEHPCHSCGRLQGKEDLRWCPKCELFWFCNPPCLRHTFEHRRHEAICERLQDVWPLLRGAWFRAPWQRWPN